MPPPGSLVLPRTRFELRFDQPVDPRSISNQVLNCDHPDPGVVFVGDPFRLTASWISKDANDVVFVQPPDLLPGRDVRLLVREGVRSAGGAPLARALDAPPGFAAVFEYRVPELP